MTPLPPLDAPAAAIAPAPLPSEAPPAEDGLTPIESRYIWVLRASMAISAIFTTAIIAAGDLFLMPYLKLPQGIATAAIALLWLILLIILPSRRVASIRYHMAEDHIRIRRGFLFTIDTIVPFVRVQHLDVSQGLIERSLGLSSLTIHTSGVLNQAVTLVGLETAHAHDMRETIHRQILTDFA